MVDALDAYTAPCFPEPDRVVVAPGRQTVPIPESSAVDKTGGRGESSAAYTTESASVSASFSFILSTLVAALAGSRPGSVRLCGRDPAPSLELVLGAVLKAAQHISLRTFLPGTSRYPARVCHDLCREGRLPPRGLWTSTRCKACFTEWRLLR